MNERWLRGVRRVRDDDDIAGAVGALQGRVDFEKNIQLLHPGRNTRQEQQQQQHLSRTALLHQSLTRIIASRKNHS